MLRLVPPEGAPFEVTQDRASVGRTPASDLALGDVSVSRRHAVLERRGASWFVLDEGSAYGTFLDGERVSEAELRPGQEIRFGELSFRIEIASPAASGAPIPPPPPLPLEALERSTGAWHHGLTLIAAKGARLPARCLKCNEQNGVSSLRRTLYWHHPALYLLILPGLLIYILAALIIQRKAAIGLPLCATHRWRRRLAIGAAWALGLGGVAGVVTGLAVEGWQGLAVVGLLVFLTGAGVGVVGTRIVTPSRIDDSFVWLRGAHTSYLQFLPAWPGDAAAALELGARAATPQPAEATGLAKAALAVGLVSLVLWCLAPIAVVLGLVAAIDLRAQPGRRGLGQAIAGGLVGAIVSAGAAVVLVFMAVQDGIKQPPGTAARPPAVLVSTDGLSRVTLPPGWKAETGLNARAELQACDTGQQACLIILTESRADFDTMTLEQHSATTRGLFLRSLKRPRLSGPARIHIDGHPALQYELRGSKDNLNFVYLHTTIETELYYHQVVAWTLTSRFAAEQSKLQALIRSFRETAAARPTPSPPVAPRPRPVARLFGALHATAPPG